MHILLIDPDEQLRDVLKSRVDEALRQVGLKRVEIMPGGMDLLSSFPRDEEAMCCFLGPGCDEEAEHTIKVFRANHPQAPLALVLDNDVYAEQAVELRRVLPVRIIALADIAQMAGFILDCDVQFSTLPGVRNRGVISVVQLKGGVGASTVAAGLASCWARHDLSVALIDLDDVNPQLTDWGRVGLSQRRAVSDLMRQGEVSAKRINEMVNPVEGYDGKLVVLPQPERYQESFHFKADVMEGAPSSALFITSMINVLREEFDILVFDTGRSWGISTFALLPHSQNVLLVTDDDGMSVRRTLDNLERLYNESDDPQEFELSKWSVVMNCYTGRLLNPKDLSNEIQELDIFPDSAMLYTIPFSATGRQWGGPGQSFYDVAEPHVKEGLRKVAYNLVPFRLQAKVNVYDKLRKPFKKFGRAS